jgi:hypothetical protein
LVFRIGQKLLVSEAARRSAALAATAAWPTAASIRLATTTLDLGPWRKKEMFNVDYGMYNPKCLDFQDEQQRQVACCRDFYVDRQKSVDRISILDADEVEEPLERTRLYGPFCLDVLRWVKMNPFVQLIVDADGKECVEY